MTAGSGAELREIVDVATQRGPGEAGWQVDDRPSLGRDGPGAGDQQEALDDDRHGHRRVEGSCDTHAIRHGRVVPHRVVGRNVGRAIPEGSASTCLFIGDQDVSWTRSSVAA